MVVGVVRKSRMRDEGGVSVKVVMQPVMGRE